MQEHDKTQANYNQKLKTNLDKIAYNIYTPIISYIIIKIVK